MANPTPKSIAIQIEQLYLLGKDYFLPHLRREKKKYQWDQLANAIIDLAK